MNNDNQTAAVLPEIPLIENFVIDAENCARQADYLQDKSRHSPKVIWIPLDEISVMEGFNGRKLRNYFNSQDEMEAWAMTFLDPGQSNPGKVDAVVGADDKITYIIDEGHRRFSALKWLESKGYENLRFCAEVNSSKTTPEQRLERMLTSNSGKPLEDDEIADILSRLQRHGYKPEKLAAISGIPKAKVYKLISFSEENIEVKQAVSDGHVAITTVMELKKTVKNRQERTEAINKAVDTKKETGSAKKVTAADIAPTVVDAKRKQRADKVFNAIRQNLAVTEISSEAWETMYQDIYQNI